MAEPVVDGPGEPPSVAALSVAESAAKGKASEQEINPWDVQAATDEQGNILAFDYEAISRKWATNLIDAPLLERFTRLTGHKPHRWLRRGLFFSHRDFDLILDCYERGDPFFLYTGRGPSSDSMHIGHTIPFEFTKWLQDVFDVPLVIMLTDDEKALFKDALTFEETMQFSRDNAKDIISMGFDEKKTFIYSDLTFIGYGGGHMMLNALEFSKLLTFNQVRGTFGFDNSTNTGRIFFPSFQCVAAFGSSYPEIFGFDPSAESFRSATAASYPCLIPCAIDQDPYFRLVRENAHRMRFPSPKPALLHSQFLTALQGAGGKMSASNPNSAIFMNDTAKKIKDKINKHAFSGGQETKELQEKLGGNPDVDVAFQYMTYFEDDDEKLAKIEKEYREGKLMTGELKKLCIEHLQAYVAGYQERRAKVGDDVMARFMTPRKLEWKGNPNPDLEKQKKYADEKKKEEKRLAEEKKKSDKAREKAERAAKLKAQVA